MTAITPTTEVRDPLHGGISVSRDELTVLDTPLFQRLRHIKQLGFSELSFPGATHVRYLHSVGAMHLAGRAFDQLFERADTPPVVPARRAELRRLMRFAALLHDVGHAPFSHAAEFAMPPVGDLDVPAYAGREPGGERATHEDYTVKIITDSSLTPILARHLPAPPTAVAALVDPSLPVEDAWFEAGGVDWRPLLQQLISSELDVDRMDYLARDSHYAGVHYGVFDVNWLSSHLACHVVDGRANLALEERAIYAFDDFLIARYHMFLMVYYHYRSVAYEEMLKQYFGEGGDGYVIPADIEEYARVDDYHLVSHLRRSDNDWARRIVQRDEYKLLLERHGNPDEVDISTALRRLAEAGVPHFSVRSSGVLSKYFRRRQGDDDQQVALPLGESSQPPPQATPIWVLERPYRGATTLRAHPLENSTDLFTRYADQVRMERVYVPAADVPRAGEAVDGVV